MKTHFSLPARDLEATTEFYTALFGSGPVKSKPDFLKFDPEGLSLNITFHIFANSTEVALPQQMPHHLGIEVGSDAELQLVFKRLQSIGAAKRPAEASHCCYALQRKFHAVDPAGFQWEVYKRLSDEDTKNSNPSTKSGENNESSCCADSRCCAQ